MMNADYWKLKNRLLLDLSYHLNLIDRYILGRSRRSRK